MVWHWKLLGWHLLVLWTLVACGGVSSQAVATSAPNLSPTASSVPTSTPEPTRTLRPTATPEPTMTPPPTFTVTPTATETPIPKPTLTPLPTATVVGGGGKLVFLHRDLTLYSISADGQNLGVLTPNSEIAELLQLDPSDVLPVRSFLSPSVLSSDATKLQISVQRDVDGNGEGDVVDVYLLNAVDNSWTSIRYAEHLFNSFSWSPNGNYALLSSYFEPLRVGREGYGQTLVDTADFSKRNLPNASIMFWSADDETVFYSKNADYFTLEIKNEAATRLVCNECSNGAISYVGAASVEGDKVAFANTASEIIVSDPDFSGVKVIPGERNVRSLVWAPGGRMLITISGRTGPGTIRLLDTETEQHHTYSMAKMAADPPWVEFCDWSPDGKSFVYMARGYKPVEELENFEEGSILHFIEAGGREYGYVSNIFVQDVEGREPTLLSRNVVVAGAGCPVWLPDGVTPED